MGVVTVSAAPSVTASLPGAVKPIWRVDAFHAVPALASVARPRRFTVFLLLIVPPAEAAITGVVRSPTRFAPLLKLITDVPLTDSEGMKFPVPMLAEPKVSDPDTKWK